MMNSVITLRIMPTPAKPKKTRLTLRFDSNVSEIRALKEEIHLYRWALREFYDQMFAHLGFMNGPQKYSEVIPWLVELEHHFNPVPQVSFLQPNNGDPETVPARRRRNATSIPSLTSLTV